MSRAGGATRRGPAAGPEVLVRRARAGLAGVALVSAAFWGVAAAMLARTVAGVSVGVIAGAVAAGLVVWRARAVRSPAEVALWIEARVPALRYALVTAIDRRSGGTGEDAGAGDVLRRAVTDAQVDLIGLLRRAGSRHLLPAAGGCLAAILLVRQVTPPASGRHVARGAHTLADVRSRLSPITVVIRPPAYARLPARALRDPADVAGLAGSTVLVRGPGVPDGLAATFEGQAGLPGPAAAVGGSPNPSGGTSRTSRVTTTLAVRPGADASGTGWQVVVGMPEGPALLRIRDASRAAAERLLILAPQRDAPPAVELIRPSADTVLAAATGEIPLEAHASDDIGLADGAFEVIVTAGSEESGGVHGRVLTLGQVQLSADAHRREATLVGTLRLGALALGPGTVLSVRAIAHDGNAIEGPGVGTSDTRTIRIATKEEADSIAVPGAAPTVSDRSLESERAIVLATTALLRRLARAPALPKDSLVERTRRLAGRQDGVRSALTGLLSGGDEGQIPVADALTAPERALLDSALRAMTDAASELGAIAPRRALPLEQRAATMLDSARGLAPRVYMRSRPPRIVVDVGRVRLTGTEHPQPGPRARGPVPDVSADRWLARLAAPLAALARAGEEGASSATAAESALGGPAALRAVIDSLAVIRVDAMAPDPPLGAALGDLLTAIRDGRDARDALAHTRTVIGAGLEGRAGLSEWILP